MAAGGIAARILFTAVISKQYGNGLSVRRASGMHWLLCKGRAGQGTAKGKSEAKR